MASTMAMVDGDGEVQVSTPSVIACLPAWANEAQATTHQLIPTAPCVALGVRRWRSLVGLPSILTPTFTFTPLVRPYHL